MYFGLSGFLRSSVSLKAPGLNSAGRMEIPKLDFITFVHRSLSRVPPSQ